MNTDVSQLKMYLEQLAESVPAILVCLVAGIVIVARWRDAPGAAPLALFGFGLLFVLCFVLPLVYIIVQNWVLQNGQAASRMWAFTAFSWAVSTLRAVIYLCLLLAIFAGRPKAHG